jgi:lipid-binding SYLF domain-containing protein
MAIRKIIFSAAATLVVAATTPAVAGPRQDARLLNATEVLNELQSSPDQNVPHWLLERAYAVAIVPDVIKVGLGIGGRRGSGVLVVRKDNGHWGNPVFVNLTGGSVGFQIGVQSADVMLVFTSRAGVDGIVGGKVTLGADASVAAGPVGRQTAAATDVGFNAQVYAYSRAKGLFAGVALDGSALTISHSSNAEYYGKPGILASQIIAKDAPAAPETAQQFVGTLNKMLGISTGTAYAQAGTADSALQPSSSSSPVYSSGQSAEPGKLTTRPMEDQNPGAEPPN